MDDLEHKITKRSKLHERIEVLEMQLEDLEAAWNDWVEALGRACVRHSAWGESSAKLNALQEQRDNV